MWDSIVVICRETILGGEENKIFARGKLEAQEVRLRQKNNMIVSKKKMKLKRRNVMITMKFETALLNNNSIECMV